MKRFMVRLGLAVGLAVLAPLAAQAKFCGDNVDGRPVPCACGDTVVSNRHLSTDPVTRTVCPADGLIVRALGASGITLNLTGKTLHGSGKGVGILVVHGGAGGARIVSAGGPATLDGFRDGIAGRGADAIALIDNVLILNSARDGVQVDGIGYTVHATEVRNAGRHGFNLSGSQFTVSATRALFSKQFGYFVMGGLATLGEPGAGNEAMGSGLIGFHILGTGIHLVDCTAAGGHDGIRMNAQQATVTNCLIQNNDDEGIIGLGTYWTLRQNRVLSNGNNGLLVRGQYMVDGGGNSGTGNRGAHQHHPAAQCEINGLPCVP